MQQTASGQNAEKQMNAGCPTPTDAFTMQPLVLRLRENQEGGKDDQSEDQSGCGKIEPSVCDREVEP